MFFTVNKSCNLEHITDVVSHDHGWTTHNVGHRTILYKGYCVNSNIHDKITNDNFAPEHGCYIILEIDTNSVKMHRDLNCNVPVFWNNTGFGNDYTIANQNLLPIKETIKFNKNDQTIELLPCAHNKNFLQDTITDMVTESISVSEAIEQINRILHQTIQNFFKNNQGKTQFFLSGGMDSTTIASVMWQQKIDVEPINYSKVVYDQHINENFQSWSNQYSALKDTCYDPATDIFVFGYNGDENFGRHPFYINQLIPNLYDKVKTRTQDYSYDFFFNQRPYHAESMKQNKSVPYNFAVASAINRVVHSYSTFHIAGNIHFNPLQDHRILQTILQMNAQDVIDQMMTGIINKKIIEMNCPQLLDSIADYKNIDGMHNLKDKHYQLFDYNN